MRFDETYSSTTFLCAHSASIHRYVWWPTWLDFRHVFASFLLNNLQKMGQHSYIGDIYNYIYILYIFIFICIYKYIFIYIGDLRKVLPFWSSFLTRKVWPVSSVSPSDTLTALPSRPSGRSGWVVGWRTFRKTHTQEGRTKIASLC